MSTQLPGSENPADIDALRDEIQAAIAAGREVGPDMDRHLADSVLERYRAERTARQMAVGLPPPAPTPPAPRVGPDLARVVISVAALAAVVAILILRPELWWLIFVLPAVAGWWGWDHWGDRRSTRDEARETNRQLRIARMRDEMSRLNSGRKD